MTLTAQTKQYLSCAETAKLVRQALAREFPGVRFSVRSKTYSGGASITVGWTDGPLDKDVSRVVKQYEGSGFDGMIDLKSGRDHWLSPEGRVLPHRVDIGHSYGSTTLYPAPGRPDAVLVSFGADYVFTNRSYTDARTCPCRSEHSRATLLAQMVENDQPGYPSTTTPCRGCHQYYYDSNADAFVRYANA